VGQASDAGRGFRHNRHRGSVAVCKSNACNAKKTKTVPADRSALILCGAEGGLPGRSAGDDACSGPPAEDPKPVLHEPSQVGRSESGLHYIGNRRVVMRGGGRCGNTRSRW